MNPDAGPNPGSQYIHGEVVSNKSPNSAALTMQMVRKQAG